MQYTESNGRSYHFGQVVSQSEFPRSRDLSPPYQKQHQQPLQGFNANYAQSESYLHSPEREYAVNKPWSYEDAWSPRRFEGDFAENDQNWSFRSDDES